MAVSKIFIALFLSFSFFSVAMGGSYPYTIYGYVYNEKGEPIEGVEVSVINERTKEKLLNITDEHGFYKVNLGNMPSGWEDGDEISIVAKGSGKYSGWEGKTEISVSISDIAQKVDITIHPSLRADFKYSPSKIIEGETVNFTDTSIHTNVIVNYTWDFGDGNISYEKNPRHVYAKNGTYAVKLTIKDEKGRKDVAIKQVEVLPTPFTISFTYEPKKPKVNEDIYFNISADKNIVNYTWDFGDGNVSYEKNAVHRYSESGTYTVKLSVINKEGERANFSRNIEISEKKTPGFSFLFLISAFTIMILVKRKKHI